LGYYPRCKQTELEATRFSKMVNNPPFNYGEFAIVNLNIAIKLGSHRLLLQFKKQREIHFQNLSPSFTGGISDAARIASSEPRSSNNTVPTTQFKQHSSNYIVGIKSSIFQLRSSYVFRRIAQLNFKDDLSFFHFLFHNSYLSSFFEENEKSKNS